MSLTISLSTLQRVAPLTSTTRLTSLLQYVNDCFPKAEITTEIRAAMFLAQTCVESMGFTSFEENLNYSTAERIAEVWRHRFTVQSAARLVRNPQALGNAAYADHMGNGDEASGDGWKFRGRGVIQLTGFENYLRLSRETGIDFVARPDLVAMPENAFLAAAHFWSWKWLNHEADKGDVPGATKKIQGGTQGLTERAKAFDRACESLGVLWLANVPGDVTTGNRTVTLTSTPPPVPGSTSET